MTSLNTVEIEIPGNKIVMDATWPRLTIAEATVLQPLVRTNGTE